MSQNKPPKLLIFFEYAYLVLTAFFAFEAYRSFAADDGKGYLMVGLAIAALFMFFFRRRFRKKRGG